jgi:hypothetical protein
MTVITLRHSGDDSASERFFICKHREPDGERSHSEYQKGTVKGAPLP